MSRDTSPHIIGKYWLDRRRGATTPNWQIAWYNDATRTIGYRSTGTGDLGAARDVIDAHYHSEKAGAPQDASALVVPQLILYWREHGKGAIKPEQIASSLRQFIAFLFQDKAGPSVTFTELRPEVFQRFQRWRMAPHSYSIGWQGKTYEHTSTGVKGESVQRNLDDVRAALNHAVGEGRVPYAPKVKSVRRDLRSPPRERVLSIDELASMVAYSLGDKVLLRYILAMLATASRPEAVRAWQVDKQADLQHNLFDCHPPGAPRTKKHNPVVPIPAGWRPWLRQWMLYGEPLPSTVRTRWRTMRRVLALGDDVHAKTIRHTVATYMRRAGVPELDIKGQIGHSIGVTGIYAKHRPDYLQASRIAIDALWDEVMEAVHNWLAVRMRYETAKGAVAIGPRMVRKPLRMKHFAVVGDDGLEPPTLSV